MASFGKILVIQTAFIGDVVLATSLLEKLHQHFPSARIDFLLRKGNEALFDNHPFVNKILIWDKKKRKHFNLLRLLFTVRRTNYDLIVNPQRYLSTGLLTGFSGAKTSVCFNKNPLSWLATHRVPHTIGDKHEVQRNHDLISQWTDNQPINPKIYPSDANIKKVQFSEKYITISPASVWFTKQFPKERWLTFMDRVGEDTTVFLLGGTDDHRLCSWLQAETKHSKTIVKAGELTFLESAALMKNAQMNFVNDSAPLHFASAMDAPVTAIYCSTTPSFGFGPLSSNSSVLETNEALACRPCGLHGKSVCPKEHFRCSNIEIELLLAKLP